MPPAVLLLLLLASDFQAVFRSGLLALNHNDLPAARTQLEEASRLQPGNGQVWAALAQAYWKLQQPQRASTAATRAERLGPQDPLVQHGLAMYYSETGAVAKAAPFEARYALAAPGDPGAILRAMTMYLETKQTQSAIDLAHRFPGWDQRADVRNLLGKAYGAIKQYEACAAELREAVRLNPYEESYIFDLANLFLREEKFEGAIQVLQDGRKNFDKSPQLELALGVAYYGLRRFPEAVDAFLKTIALAPGVEQPYVFLGKMLEQAGHRLPEITARFAGFEKDNPSSYLGYLLHAKALSAAGADPQEAARLLRLAIERNPRDWEAHFELATNLTKQSQFPEAAKEFERSIELNPKEPTPHYRLARVYDRLGKPEAAQEQRALHEKLLKTSGAAR